MAEELLKRMFEAVDAGDWKTMTGFYAADCAYDRPGFPSVVGLPGLTRFYAHERPIQSGSHRLTRIVREGDAVCAFGAFEGQLRSGAPIALEFADLYLMRENLIGSRKTYFFTPLA